MVVATNPNVLRRIVHADPLSPRGTPIGVRTKQDLTILSNRSIHSLKLQSEKIVVGSTLRELDIVLSIVASGALLRRVAISPT